MILLLFSVIGTGNQFCYWRLLLAIFKFASSTTHQKKHRRRMIPAFHDVDCIYSNLIVVKILSPLWFLQRLIFFIRHLAWLSRCPRNLIESCGRWDKLSQSLRPHFSMRQESLRLRRLMPVLRRYIDMPDECRYVPSINYRNCVKIEQWIWDSNSTNLRLRNASLRYLAIRINCRLSCSIQSQVRQVF